MEEIFDIEKFNVISDEENYSYNEHVVHYTFFILNFIV